MYIKRHLEDAVLSWGDSSSVILVTGPRQAGKTTILKMLSNRKNRGREYVTLDDLNERSMAKKRPHPFLQLHPPPVLIDEVQYHTHYRIFCDSCCRDCSDFM